MRTAALALAFLFLVSPGPHAAPEPSAPKLAVIIVVDQMRADYVDRFRGDWTGGLKRMAAQGAWFKRAAYPYLTTVTCAGHATISTGAFPHTHGIFQNIWWDRQRATLTPCTEDPDKKGVRYDDKSVSGGDSASRLLVPAFSDEMRRLRSAHVVALSLKERSAIMLAPGGGDAVTWLSSTLDGWQTSTAFASKPVDAVKEFIKDNSIDADYGKTWSKILPEGRYSGSDDGLAEAPPPGWTRTFPHALTSRSGKPDIEFHQKWERSPYADAYLGRFAAALVESMQLGKHAGTDVLGVSFSSPDLMGHGFGPRSHEVQDMFAQLDRTIGTLLDRLDTLVGRDEYVVALSADHGITPMPEQLVKEGHDAGRFDAAAMTEAIEARVQAVLALGPGRFVARLNGNDLYFQPGVYDRLLTQRSALDAIVQAIASMPGVAKVFTSEQLRTGDKSTDPLLRAAALSYVPERSGDIVLVPKPGWMFSNAGTTHGSATPDDQRVPIVFFGYGVKAGEYSQPATPADIAPTLAAICNIGMPRAEGRVLTEAMGKRVQTNPTTPQSR